MKEPTLADPGRLRQSGIYLRGLAGHTRAAGLSRAALVADSDLRPTP